MGTKNTKKAIEFSLMVCGSSGTGRTTFVNMLCGKRVLEHVDPDEPMGQGLQIRTTTIELQLEEEHTCVSLTIVDTPGFGDEIDNEESFAKIVGYLEKQHDDHLMEESRIKRNPRFRDNRVHAMLYFITPTGHGLRELDIELMKRLASRVNVIPVIGRADSLTPSELAQSKELILEDIEYHRIPVYNFPHDVDDDDETIEENTELRRLMPFAIVSSEEVMEVGGQMAPVRKYPWGCVEVNNPHHSDVLAIRSALLHSHLVDLKEITYDVLYEDYRTTKLSKVLQGEDKGESNPDQRDLSEQIRLLQGEKLRKEEERLREVGLRLQREIDDKRQELLVREAKLREMETRIQRKAGGAAGKLERASSPVERDAI
ncbi:Septin-domain-containing protein [Microdochium bolleyi]|uniref:Septin-domain-containing protein n=1 Tax=Microdochium bolleyi TaxID=196109 RepID=A0A136ILF7_9PEZI|nr:Septin-domain-containing protein [Microdochium bolleyi]